MKKIGKVFLALVLPLAVTACGNNEDPQNQEQKQGQNQQGNNNQSSGKDEVITVSLDSQTFSGLTFKFASATEENYLNINAYDQLFDEEFMPLKGFPAHEFEVHIYQDGPITGTVTFSSDANSSLYATMGRYFENGTYEQYGTKGGQLIISQISDEGFKGKLSGVIMQEYDCDGEGEESNCFYVRGGKELKVNDIEFEISEEYFNYIDCDDEKNADICKE